MGSLGETLKREREARGISLEEISEHTKIGVRLLKAIEAEQFGRLPGGIFDKSFVRQYARYLGLDEEKIVREYLQAVGGVAESPVPPKASSRETKAAPSVHSYPRIVLTAVCLGALAAGVFYAIHRFRERLAPSSSTVTVLPPESGPLSGQASATFQEKQSASPATLPPTPSNPATANSTPSSPPPREQPSRERPPAPAGEVVAGEGTAARELLLRIDSRSPVWLSIAADGKKQWQGTLQANQTRQIQAAESVRLAVGDAGAVELTLNGKPLPPLGRSGEVRTVIITAKGLPEPAP